MEENRLGFPPDVTVLASVRRFAADTADRLGATVDREDLAVVVGELAANAAVHQQGDAELIITPLAHGGLQIEVCDGDRTLVDVVDGPSWDLEGHRGLLLVDALSDAWGVDVSPSGKRVWARLVGVAGDAREASAMEAGGRQTRRVESPT